MDNKITREDLIELGWTLVEEKDGRVLFENKPVYLRISFNMHIVHIYDFCKDRKEQNRTLFSGKVEKIEDLKLLFKLLMFENYQY